MTKQHEETRRIRFVRILCADLPAHDIEAAEENFRTYLSTAWRIFERLERERAEARNPQPPIRQADREC